MNYAFNPTKIGSTPSFDQANEWSSLLADIKSRREAFMVQRQTPMDIIERLRAVGIYRALVAKKFGGDERSPAEFCRLIETIATADGSVAWVSSFGVAATYLAALPEATLRQVYANGPDVVFAGGLFPLQPATQTADGFIVNGTWKFGSGSPAASLIGVGITTGSEQSGGLPRVAVMPASQVSIRSNWDVMGLQGTGSHDLVVDNVHVPEEWTFIRGGSATIDAPIYRYPSMAFAAQVLAVVGLGVARTALNDVIEMSGGRASITGAPKMADRAHVQLEIAKAEVALRSARAFFYEMTDAVWATVVAGDRPSVEEVSLLRLGATNAARVGADVARMAFGLAGTTAIYNGHGLSRALNDSLVVAQHAFLGEGTYQSAGRILLGLPAAPGFP